MEEVSREELALKAKEINDKLFGRTRKKKSSFQKALNEQVNASTKFALEKSLKLVEVPKSSKKAFVELLKEQNDAINLLFVGEKEEAKVVEMLKPLFGEKSRDFIRSFRDVFNKLQSEIELDKQKFQAS